MCAESKPIPQIVNELTAVIADMGDPKKALWLKNYVKHNIQSRGVGIPILRKLLDGKVKEANLTQRNMDDQVRFMNEFMCSEYTEDKLVAILFMQLYWRTKFATETLTVISNWFQNEWISDWNVCDWLCVRVLSPLLDEHPESCIDVFERWNREDYLWTARASLVPFAQCQTRHSYPDYVERFSVSLIQRPERFCKTAVGWVMREWSKEDPTFVRDFLKMHETWVTPEVRRNAKKYFNDLNEDGR